MSVRTALVLTIAIVSLVTTLIFGLIGAYSISQSVIYEAQSRVDHDLRLVILEYDRRLEDTAQALREAASDIDSTNPRDELRDQLTMVRNALQFSVLNLCTSEGEPIAGTYSNSPRVPVVQDPVIREALQGSPASGTVLLDSSRIRLEGGAALQNGMSILNPQAKTEVVTDSALYWWFALPMRDSSGQVTAILYGGQALNYNLQLVDNLAELISGQNTYEGKPMSTVTIFLKGIRVATNVVGPTGSRAIGTRVSSDVQSEVLENGRRWSGRAYVVDAWYLSGYEPLVDPDGTIIGMLYFGLLEAPYSDLQARLLARFLAPVIVIGTIAILAGLFLVRRITRPLESLSAAADSIRRGEWDTKALDHPTYMEINHLSRTFQSMQAAISARDRELREQNQKLADANEKLMEANQNYMQMLGFITHEIRSPVSTIETMTDVLLKGLLGDIPKKVRDSLTRVKRNCEELQDMVSNYLDLSRAERGELVVEKSGVNVPHEIVKPIVEQTQILFESRGIALKVNCSSDLTLEADARLLKMALGNYLTNAAKYGRESGRAKLDVSSQDGKVVFCVWNEGPGFSTEDQKKLFQKFSRIRNRETQTKRGSGLGLFLCKKVIEEHGGSVWAESEVERWARFCFSIPLSRRDPDPR